MFEKYRLFASFTWYFQIFAAKCHIALLGSPYVRLHVSQWHKAPNNIEFGVPCTSPHVSQCRWQEATKTPFVAKDTKLRSPQDPIHDYNKDLPYFLTSILPHFLISSFPHFLTSSLPHFLTSLHFHIPLSTHTHK